MKQVLTIVHTDGLAFETRLSVESFLARGGVAIEEIRHLDCSVEVDFNGEIQVEAVSAWAESRKVDFAIQPVATRRKKLLISDMESTLVENEFLDDLAGLCGVGDQVKAITARAMNGEIDFGGSLVERVGLLTGQPVGLLDRAYENLHWMAGAKELFEGLKANGVRTIIVSGGFKFFTSRVREILGADEDFSNDLEVEDGNLTGRPILPVAGREEKQRILQNTARSMGISLDETAAIGDGANDLPMLLTAGLGVAFRAKPSVVAEARFRIIHSDLRAMLYFMGLVPQSN